MAIWIIKLTFPTSENITEIGEFYLRPGHEK
jgi:hypothetical protein